MALSIFIISLIVVILALSIDYYRGRREKLASLNALNANDTELKEMRLQNLTLQDEVTDLKNKLQNTFIDPVTSLLGWQLFEDRVRQALKDSERHHFTMGLAMVDIDDFKMINDALGYDTGDLVLKEVAQRLNECLREVDNVSRFSKDTFVVMLTQLTKPETAAIVAQRILQALAMPFQIGEQELHLTTCVGVALFPIDAKDAQTLLSRADHALHLAKTKGHHVCQFYEERMQAKSVRDLQFANVVSREEYFSVFSLRFQPIFDVTKNQIFCVEAGLVWQHQDLGLIEQDEIAFYAERHRKLNALSVWMLTKACEEFKRMQSQELNIPVLALPISIKQLENAHFIYEISQVFQQQEFKPEWLLIELKPHHAPISFDILQKAFNMLHYLGVKIAVSHFGSYSLSLRYLNAMKVNYLKLDHVFADDIADNAETRKLLKATKHFADDLDMQLIVSGVSQKNQVEVLRTEGVHLLEGDFFCQALSADELLTSNALVT